MNLFNCCLGDKIKSSNKKRRASTDFRLSKKSLDKLKLNLTELENQKESFNESPFRKKKKESLNNSKPNIKEKENIDKFNYNEQSTLKGILTKQKMSNFDSKVLQFLDEKEKTENNKIKNRHWEHKEVFKCFFCGGRTCKHENYLKNKTNNAIEGLHSNLINDDIIASQRPSTYLILKFDLVDKFKGLNIGLIVNVQREGEHPHCGPNEKLEESGFSYNPHIFLTGDVKCKVSGWKDMSVPHSVNFILEIVKEMSIVIKEKNKKVLVHCHAGYGRTGVVIACYMIYHSSKTVSEIVEDIRKKRSECIQKKEQFSFCEKFYDFIKISKLLFNLPPLFSTDKKSIEYFLNNQKDILFGLDYEKFENVPKIVFTILDLILKSKQKHNVDLQRFYKILCFNEKHNPDNEEILLFLKKSINKGNFEILNNTENIVILSQLLYDWLEDDVKFVINPDKIVQIMHDYSFRKSTQKTVDNFFDDLFLEELKEERRILYIFLKSQLTEAEYETLLMIAQFFECVSPDSEDDNEKFVDTIDKLCANLLGYNYSVSYYSSNKILMERISFQVTNLTNIIRLLLIGLKYDFDTTNYFYPESHNILKNFNLLPKYKRNTTKSINTYIREGKINLHHNLDKKDFKNKNVSISEYNIQNLNINNNEINNLMPNQQQNMLKTIYNSLGNYLGMDSNKQGTQSRKISENMNFSSELSIILPSNNDSSFKPLQIKKISSRNSFIHNSYLNNNKDDENNLIEYLKDFFDEKPRIAKEDKLSQKDIISQIYSPNCIINEAIDKSFLHNSNKKYTVEKNKDKLDQLQYCSKYIVKYNNLNENEFKDDNLNLSHAINFKLSSAGSFMKSQKLKDIHYTDNAHKDKMNIIINNQNYDIKNPNEISSGTSSSNTFNS